MSETYELDGDALVARLEAETMRANAAEDRATDEKERADAAERLLARACEHIVGLVDGRAFRAECQCSGCLAYAFLREVGR